MPKLPRFTARGAPQARRASASDFGGFGASSAALGASIAEVGEAARQIAEAEQGSRVTEELTRAGAELESYRTELESDPEVDTQEERFRERVREVSSRGRERFGGRFRREFELSLGRYAVRLEQGVRERVRERRIDQSIATLDESLQSLTDRRTRSEDVAEQQMLEAQVDQALERAVSTSVISAQDGVRLRRSFRDRVADGEVARELREDPGGTTLRLLDPEDSLSKGIPEAKRQQLIDRGIDAFHAEIARRNAAEDRARIAQERLEEAQGEEARRTADDLLAAGDLDGLESFVAQARGVLSPDAYRFYLRRIAAGGGFSDSQSNREAYVDLSNRALEGEDIRGALDEAFLGGLIDQDDRRRLLEAQDDVRFQDAERFLVESLKVSEQALGQDAFVARAASADARRSFTQWKLEHPNATRAEAISEARALVKDAAVVDLSLIEAAQLKPRYAVRAANRVDVEATYRATIAAAERGEIDQGQLAEQLRRLEAVERAQTAADERTAARQADTGGK